MPLGFALGLGVFVFNLPMGYIRAGAPRWSRVWARTLYIPICLDIALRWALGSGYALLPYLAAGTLGGQLLGAWVRRRA